MECEFAVSVMSTLMHICGWAGLASSQAIPKGKATTYAYSLLIACLVGLGGATLTHAVMQSPCALTNGFATTLLFLAVIVIPMPEHAAIDWSTAA